MLRGESGGDGGDSGGGGGGRDDCCCRCCCDDDSDRAEPAVEFAVAGIMLDAPGASRVVAICRRRRCRTTGDVGEDEDADADDTDDEDVVMVWALVEEVLPLLVLPVGGAGGEFGGESPATPMPKGVFSSFTLEEDATFLVAGCTRGWGDCAETRVLSLRWW